jgi:hypothetical protein
MTIADPNGLHQLADPAALLCATKPRQFLYAMAKDPPGSSPSVQS